jgi:acyl carrier protein
VTDRLSLTESGLDDLDLVEMIMALEEEFGLELEIEEAKIGRKTGKRFVSWLFRLF